MPRKALETRTKEIKEENIDTKSIEEKITKNIEKKISSITEGISDKIDEQIEYKIDKYMKEEEKKVTRRTKFKVFRLNCIIIILLGIIAYFTYCLYDIDYFKIRTMPVNDTETNKNINQDSNNSSDNNEPDISQEVDKQLLIDKYKYLVENLNIEDEEIFNLYKDKVTIDNISNELKLKISYKNLDSSKIKIEQGVESFNIIDFEQSYRKIFGNSSFSNEIFTYNNTRFMFYNNTYIGLKEEQTAVSFLQKIIDIKEENDQLKFKVIFAKLSENGELLNENNEVILGTYNDENLKEYENILPTYLLTFNKYVNDYIFTSVEKTSNNI